MNKNNINNLSHNISRMLLLEKISRHNHNINLTRSTYTYAHTRDNFEIPKFTHLVLTFYSHMEIF